MRLCRPWMVRTATPWSVLLWRGSFPPKGLSFDSEIDCTSCEQMVSAEMRPVSPWQEDGDDAVLLEGSPQRRSPQPQPATVGTALPAPVVLSLPPVESVPKIQRDAEEELISNVRDDGPHNAEDGGKRPRMASNEEDIQADIKQLVSNLFTTTGHEELDWIGLHLFNDDTRPSGHISRPSQVGFSNSCLCSIH